MTQQATTSVPSQVAPTDIAVEVDALVSAGLKALAEYDGYTQERLLLLPHVIRYNGAIPTKLTGWPKYEDYQAPQRFQDIARLLGLPAGTPAEGVESYASAIERLRDAAGIPRSFQAIGVDEQTFLASLPQQSLNAYQDQCAPANPRMPMLDDMQKIMRTAYYGA